LRWKSRAKALNYGVGRWKSRAEALNYGEGVEKQG